MIKIVGVGNGGFIQVDLHSIPPKLDGFVRALNAAAEGISREAGRNEAVDTTKYCQKLAREFDGIFGKDACRKTFGTDVPGIPQLEEFWDRFLPLARGWVKEMEV